MVEFHRARRIRSPAIEARQLSDALQEIHLLLTASPPAVAVPLGWRSRLQDLRCLEPVLKVTSRVLRSGTDAMAVAADDVALRDLGGKDGSTLEERPPGRQAERLGSRVTMIEIHDVGRKRPAAVEAWHAPQVAKPLQRCSLAANDPLDLRRPVAPVVADVEQPLARRTSRGHAA